MIRRGAATSAVKAIAEFGQDNPESDGNEIDTNILVAFLEGQPVRLRKFDGSGLSAFRAVEGFGPMVPPGHSPNMRLSQSPSSRYPCHNPKSTDGRSRPRARTPERPCAGADRSGSSTGSGSSVLQGSICLALLGKRLAGF